MRKSKSIHFFATRRDLEAILGAVESQRRLKYTQAGMFDSPETSTFASGLQIPNLGLAPSGESNLEPFWLITDNRAQIEVKAVPQRHGAIRYGIDPGLNPESVVFWPGGVFEDSCVIAGQIGTAMINPTSMEVLNLFTREIRRQFKRMKSFFVGPEAEQLLDAGYRLTHGIGTAKECDLSRG
jgi:hypothetical protein